MSNTAQINLARGSIRVKVEPLLMYCPKVISLESSIIYSSVGARFITPSSAVTRRVVCAMNCFRYLLFLFPLPILPGSLHRCGWREISRAIPGRFVQLPAARYPKSNHVFQAAGGVDDGQVMELFQPDDQV